MRTALEILFVAGLATIAMVIFAMFFVTISMPWRLDDSDRSGSLPDLLKRWAAPGWGIWLWRFRALGIRLLVIGFVSVVASGTTMLLVWGE